jgi:hypothetical protein
MSVHPFVNFLRLLEPDAIAELTSSAKVRLVLFLHFPWSLGPRLFVVLVEVAKQLKYSITD